MRFTSIRDGTFLTEGPGSVKSLNHLLPSKSHFGMWEGERVENDPMPVFWHSILLVTVLVREVLDKPSAG